MAGGLGSSLTPPRAGMVKSLPLFWLIKKFGDGFGISSCNTIINEEHHINSSKSSSIISLSQMSLFFWALNSFHHHVPGDYGKERRKSDPDETD